MRSRRNTDPRWGFTEPPEVSTLGGRGNFGFNVGNAGRTYWFRDRYDGEIDDIQLVEFAQNERGFLKNENVTDAERLER